MREVVCDSTDGMEFQDTRSERLDMGVIILDHEGTFLTSFT